MLGSSLNHKEIDFKEPIKTKHIQGSYKKSHKEKARGKRYVLSYDIKSGRRCYYKNTLDEVKKTLMRALNTNDIVNYINIYDIEEEVRISQNSL